MVPRETPVSADPLEAQLQQAGATPVVQGVDTPEGRAAAAQLQAQGGNAPMQSRRPDPIPSGYAAGVPPLPAGAEAKPYLKANIDTLPDPTPEQLPVDDSTRYFNPDKGDTVVPLASLVPTKTERAGANALKRMAATAAGVIERRDPIDVRLTESGTYEILDGNGSYEAARQIGLNDMPVRIVEAPKGKEGWRISRGMLTPEGDAALTAAYEQADAELPAYRATLEGLAERLGGDPIVAPLKGRTRAEEKIADPDYGGDVSRLSDLLRGTIVFETADAALQAASEIRSTMKIVKDKDTMSPGTKDKGFGYRDINLVVEMPGGTKAEIQLMTRAMADAKAKGHAEYEVTRVLESKMRDGSATAAEKMQYQRAAAKQQRLYDAAVALASPAMNASRDTAAQPPVGSSGSSALSPDTARALPDTENRNPDAPESGGMSTTANTSESLRSKNMTPLPEGGMVTPSNTSATADPSLVDGDIVQDTPITRAVRALAEKLGLPAETFTILRAPGDLPPAVSSVGLDGKTEGIFFGGRVYLFTGALTSPARAIWVALHEYAGHAGLRALLPPDQYQRIMDAAGTNTTVKGIARAMLAEAKREAAKGDKGARTNLTEAQFIEEAIAELAAAYFTGDFAAIASRYGAGIEAARLERDGRGVIDRFVKAVKSFLFNQQIRMSDAEVRDLIANAYSAVRRSAPVDGRAETPATAPVAGVQSRAAAGRQASPVNPEIEYEIAGDGAVTVFEGIDELRSLLSERGITDKGKLAKGRLSFTVNQSPKILATITGETNAASRAGVVYDHIVKDGKIVGAPAQFPTEADLPKLRAAIEKLAIEGESGRFWYENSGRAVLAMVGGNKEEARKFMQLVAIYSPQADIAPNFVFALRAWLQIKSGKPVNVKTGAQDRNAEAVVRDGRPWAGEKTNNFYNNLMRAVDPDNYGADVQGVTGDLWMARAFQYDGDAPNDSQYRFIEIETNRLAQKLGWEPQHAQAAIWVALKTRMNGDRAANRAVDEASIAAGDLKIVDGQRQFNGAEGQQNHRRRWIKDALERPLTADQLSKGEYNYSNAMRDYLGQISWEARPGRTAGGVMQWINDAPMEVQAAYQEAIHQALLGRDGEDLLASQIGLPVVDYVAAPGVWQGEVAAGGQSVITLPLRKKAKDYAKEIAAREAAGEAISDADRNLVDPDAQNMITAYAAILGRLLRQEGMGWHRPDYATSKRDANGVEVRAGRVLSAEEALRFYNELDARARERGGTADDFAIISTPDGVRVLSFGSVQNLVFHEMIESSAARAIDHDDIAVELFRSDGNLISNDWEGDPDGQGYLRAATEAGHRSAAEWADRILAPRIEAANRSFAEQYGRDPAADQRAEEEVSPTPQSRSQAPTPGVPTPLYVSRPVLDDGGLRAWAERSGLTGVLPLSEMHATVTYSKAPVDVADAPAAGGEISAPASGRAIKLRSALAMPVSSPRLQAGHRRYRRAGASHDYGDGYTPHITLKYDATDAEVAALRSAPPFTGTIRLGPEEQAVLRPGDESSAPQSRARADEDPASQLDDDEIFDLLEEYGRTVESDIDAEKAWTEGDLVFINNEMSDGEPYLAQSIQQIRNTVADAMMIVRREDFDRSRAPMQSRAPSQTDTPAFKRWFGDSKVVDADGNPRVVYHGTSRDLSSFKVSQRGMFGAGIYLASDIDQAENFAPSGDNGGAVMPVYVALERPFLTDADYDVGEAADVESPAVPLIRDVFGNESGRVITRLRNSEHGHLGRSVRDRLLEMGHDGIIATYPDGSAEFVAFFPEQIKSATGNRGTFDPENPNITQSRAAKDARQTAAALRNRKSQLARELTSQLVTTEQAKAWLGRARILIGEVGASPDFAQEMVEARRALAPERREALAGDREALRRYDEARDMLALLEQQQRAVRAKAITANRLLDKAERRIGSMSLADREALVEQLSESLDAAEMAYIAAKRLADWRSGNDAKVVKAFRKRNETLGFLAAEGYQQGSMLWEGAQSLKDKAAGIRRKIRRLMQDRLIDLRDVQQAIEAQLGRSLDDLQNVYRAENQMHGKVADGIDRFRQRMVEPLKVAIRASGMTMAEVERALWAKHAPERNARIRQINPGLDAGSGMTDAEAAQILAALTPEQRAKLDGISARVEAIRRHALETLVDAGQLARDQADTILASYDNYVPLRGKDGEGEARIGGVGSGISAGNAGVRRALGRQTPPKNILAELVGDAERAIVQAGKAEVGRSLLRLVLSYPNPDLWEIEPVTLEPKFNEATGEVYLAIGKTDEAEVVIVKHNGKPYAVRIKHPQLAAALRNAGVEGTQWIVQYIGKLNRWLSAVFTRFNPGFVPVNLMRDLFQGLVGVAAELGADSAMKVIAGYGPALRATYLDARQQRGDADKADADKTMQDWVREFAASGGKTGWTSLEDVDTLQRNIENSMMTLIDVAKKNPADLLGEALGRTFVFKEIENVNDAIENAIRASTYAHLRRDKGWSKARAAEYAKEMTVNFNRKGTAGSIINALYLFYNASVQGSRRSIKLMQNPKVAATLGGIALGQATLAMTIGMMKFDDEDDETLWEKIPDYVKRRSFVIPLGFDSDGTARWISIPMPFGFNIFPAVGGYVANYASPHWRGKQTSHLASAVGYLSSTAIDALSPVAIGERGAMWPTVVRMGMNMAANRDDLGRRISMSEEFSRFEAPRASMAKPGTAAPFQWAATALNRIGGGDEYTKPKVLEGLLDVSPNDLEYLFEQLAGGPGSTLTGFMRASTREVATGDMKSFDLPIVRSVSGGARPESTEARRFYENKDRIERNLERMKDAYVEGGADGFYAMRAELGDEYSDIDLKVRKRTTENGLAGDVMADPDTGRPQIEAPEGSVLKTYRATARTVQDIAADMRRIYNNRDMDAVERQRLLIELQQERAEAVRQLNRQLGAFDAARGGG